MVITNSDFHDKVHEFKDELFSTKIRHENWKSQKRDTVISILHSRLDDIEEILKEQKFEFNIEENDNISLEMKFAYLQVELKYNQLFNGKIEVVLIYPEIKNDDESKKEFICKYDDPNEISEMTINKDLHTSFKYMKSEF